MHLPDLHGECLHLGINRLHILLGGFPLKSTHHVLLVHLVEQKEVQVVPSRQESQVVSRDTVLLDAVGKSQVDVIDFVVQSH